MKKLVEIRKIIKKSESSNKPLIMKLIAEAEFMESVLEQLKAEMTNSENEREPGINGALLHSYNSTMRNYQSTIKMLNEMLPKHVEEVKDNEFDL